MPINILMPALSPTMEKGNLAKWLKKEGDKIKSGDVLAEIETDKATMEVEAVDEGVLAKILVADGTTDVPVNQLIGLIAGEGEDATSISADQAAPAAAPPVAALPGVNGVDAKAEALAGERGYGVVPGAAPVDGAQAAASAPKTNGAARLFASPLARRIAKDVNLDLAQVSGSGPHGRIVERDVKAAIAGGGAGRHAASVATPPAAAAPMAPSAAKPAASAGMSDETIKKFFEPGSFEEVAHDGMRKTIARRLVEAKQTIPHFYVTMDCDLGALMALRETVNKGASKDKDGKPAFKVSVNDFVIKALALALIRVPDANVTWTEGAMLKHKHADIGVAVSIPGGLITPVIRKADTKNDLDHLKRDEGLCSPRPRPQTQARGISGRLVGRVESRHVRRQAISGHHQPAARHHPRGRRGRGAGRRPGMAHRRSRRYDERRLSPPIIARSMACSARSCLQAFKSADREPDGDAGLGLGRRGDRACDRFILRDPRCFCGTPSAVGRRKCALCSKPTASKDYFPLDADLSGDERRLGWRSGSTTRISRRCAPPTRSSPNLTPFRGVSADVGTVYRGWLTPARWANLFSPTPMSRAISNARIGRLVRIVDVTRRSDGRLVRRRRSGRSRTSIWWRT